MAPIYATSGDYTGFYPQAPTQADLATRLRYASRLVRRDTMTAIYDTLIDGSPSDPVIAEAFKEATCAQVYAWAVASVDPGSNGLQKSGAVISSKSLDGGAVSYDNSLNASLIAFQERKAMLEQLVPEAVMILQEVLCGLGRVWTRG